MEIEIHGGAYEVGGNKILVKNKDFKFWFDMGAKHKYYINLFEQNIVKEFGLERLKSENVFPVEIIQKSAFEENGKKYINLLLSHAHADHYSLLVYYKAWKELGVKIRIFMPEDLSNILKSRLKLARKKKVFEILDYRSIEEFNTDNFKAKPIRVDHSIDASYGYIIETKEGNIGYTGDYRFTTERDFDQMVKSFEDIDILITEATSTISHNLLKETDVKEKFKEIMEKYWDSTVICIVGWHTFTRRVRSIIEASGGRKVVLHPKIAALLNVVDDSIIKSSDVYILQTGGDKNIFEEFNLEGKRITIEEVNDERGNVVIVLPQCYRILLWRENVENSIYVRPKKDVVIASLSEPYDEESFEIISNLNNYVLKQLHVPLYHIHASGHAPLHEIGDFINLIKPKEVYVVHSQRPEILESRLDRSIKIKTR